MIGWDREDAARALVTSARVAFVVLLAVILGRPVQAQSVLQRSPNLSGGWEGIAGTVYFNFLHRFTVSPPPQRQVLNYPTFLIGAGLPGNVLLAAHYATRSGLVDAYPNEWEFHARIVPLKQFAGFPLDAGLQGGYNLAAESFDGELSLSRQLGPVRLLGAARAMSNYRATDSARIALAGGASMQFLRWFALAGDVAQVLDVEDADMAWGAALQIALPYTPHTLSLQVTNTNTMTLQGASFGDGTRRYGFEFTIPVHPARYFGRAADKAAAPVPPPSETDAPTGGPVVNARMRNLAFEPQQLRIAAGTTVVWKNEDQVMHTVKAGDASWESAQMEPGASYRRVFSQPGRYEVTCGPHPFMKVVVEVR